MPMKLRTEQDSLPPGARILISGAPLTFKTTSSQTWPGIIEHFSLPGEKGWETVPLNAPNIRQYLWETDEVSQSSPHTLIQEVESKMWEVIYKGLKENGPKWTLVLEGLHKMYGWHYKKHFLNLQDSATYRKDPDDDKISGRAYGLAHDSYQLWLHKALSLPIPYVLGTIWEGKTRDDPDSTARKAPSHIFPDLPGEMAKRIVGEFTITLYSEVSLPDPRGRQKGIWTIKPSGKIWGVGVHLPPEVAAKIPSKLEPKEWRALAFSDLEPFLQGASTDTVVAGEPLGAPESSTSTMPTLPPPPARS